MPGYAAQIHHRKRAEAASARCKALLLGQKHVAGEASWTAFEVPAEHAPLWTELMAGASTGLRALSGEELAEYAPVPTEFMHILVTGETGRKALDRQMDCCFGDVLAYKAVRPWSPGKVGPVFALCKVPRVSMWQWRLTFPDSFVEEVPESEVEFAKGRVEEE